jgi:hypothetical protein
MPRTDDSRDIVVFDIVRDSACAECGDALSRHSFLRIEGDRALCLECADLDHLVHLPSGNAALTRRATRHSTLHALVLRFSRARKRYERQGVLVEEAALERAEAECLADADARQHMRERAAIRRAALDEQYVSDFAGQLGALFPGCPAPERQAIAEHACRKYSGRVGRSAFAKAFDPTALELAVRAHVRHRHTQYDRVLAATGDRVHARDVVRDVAEEVIDRWRTGTP